MNTTETMEMNILKSIKSPESGGFVFEGIFYATTKKEVVATDGRMLGISTNPKLFIENLSGCILEPNSMTLISGNFPDYGSIVEGVESSVLKKYDFEFPYGNKLPNDRVYLYSEGDDLKVSLSKINNGIVSLNGKYLNKLYLKVGKKLRGIEMWIKDAKSPVKMRIQGMDNLTFLLMPMIME